MKIFFSTLDVCHFCIHCFKNCSKFFNFFYFFNWKLSNNRDCWPSTLYNCLYSDKLLWITLAIQDIAYILWLFTMIKRRLVNAYQNNDEFLWEIRYFLKNTLIHQTKNDHWRVNHPQSEKIRNSKNWENEEKLNSKLYSFL